MDFVTTQQLTQLRCIKCKNYLSFFPIYLSSDSPGNVCGRCTEDKYGIRNVVYEELAALQKFPCKNDINECIDHLLPKEVPLHEQYCKYRKWNCPVNDSINCKWQGRTIDLWDHFEKNHATFTLKEKQFEVDFLGNYNENHLMKFEGEIYAVHKMNENSTFTYNIHYIGNNTCAANYLYKLELQNATQKDIKIINIKKLGEHTSLDKDVVTNLLKNPSQVMAHIEIVKEEEKEDVEEFEEVQWDLIGELECSCCKKYMLPPVHQCVTGHSICWNCIQTQKVCSCCTEKFLINTVNITLGKLIDHLIYPCKNAREGCKYTCKSPYIKVHESSCAYGKFKCPLSDYVNCKEKISETNLYDHILNDHMENFLEMNASQGIETKSIDQMEDNDEDVEDEDSEDYINNKYEDCFILRFNFRLFKLHYAYRDFRILWEMQLIGTPKKKEKYEFEIKYEGGNYRVCFRKDCGTLSDKADAFGSQSSFVIIDIRQLVNMTKYVQSFIHNVRILKKNC